MSVLSDPVGDMLTRIRNAIAVGHHDVNCPCSKINQAVIKVMHDEGYIQGFNVSDDKRSIKVDLKYYAGKPVIEHIKRVSKPGIRRYTKFASIRPVLNGLGIAIISTSQGVMTDHEAKKRKIGGEVICQIA